MSITKFFACISVLLLQMAAYGPVFATEWKESRELAAVFSEAGKDGAFVVYDPDRDTFTGFNRDRAETRFLPASTFKIANALIGLSVGAVADVDEILPYGGNPQPVPACERDMSLREAIKISNIPIFQELARRIGLENMKEHLALLKYGNQNPEGKVDLFWLEGPLQISPLEQTIFLARLARYDLPVPDAVHLAVRDIILVEQTPEWLLFAKTGTAARQEPGVGWWVGWVEKGGHIYAFALNVALNGDDTTVMRVELGKACLRVLGII